MDKTALNILPCVFYGAGMCLNLSQTHQFLKVIVQIYIPASIV